MRGAFGIVVASVPRRVSFAFIVLSLSSLAVFTGCGNKSGAHNGALCADGGCDAACVNGCDAACAGGDCCTGDDQCGAGSYCDSATQRCLRGCRDDRSCAAAVDDAGVDGRVGGDGGSTAPTPWCEPQSRTCVECLSDTQCAPGQLCRGYHCSAGCNDDHGCADGESCCEGACVNLNSNKVNCGACGAICSGISQCCGGACTDVYGSDTRNCGQCGTSCSSGPHAFAACNEGDCGIGSCATGYADCNHRINDGCEVATGNDVMNCGGCGKTCVARPHSTSLCVGGYCEFECSTGYADCDGQPDNGCEVDLRSDFVNCGACGTVCPSNAHTTYACEAARCVLKSCESGWEDCNGVADDGCETGTTSDTKNCGRCGTICPSVPNGAPACDNGRCGATACGGNWRDCNSNLGDGCETDISSDTANCGACRSSCPSPANGLAGCLDSTCVLASCNPGYGDCNKLPGDGCEANLSSDPLHCGSCANACSLAHASSSCLGGSCQLGPCASGWGDCDNNPATGCEADLTSIANCGRCGNACANRPNTIATTCTGGTCGFVCATDFADCNRTASDGCEANLKLSVSNCGGCGMACPTRTHSSVMCNGGTCNYACSAGWHDCDGNAANGCETDYNDVQNCGGCGMTCPARPNTTVSCASGTCGYACVAGWADCDGNAANGCETSLQTNVGNCGACGMACTTGPNQAAACTGGACSYACVAGWADCDGVAFNGCEKAIDNDPLNCGGCARTCQLVAHAASVGCSSSACTITGCASGYQDCDGSYANGCEAHPTDDVQNCGGCGKVCPPPSHAAAACSGGVCGMGTCSSGWANCDGDTANGCEQNIATDVNHCGSCATVCSVAHGTPGCSSGNCTVASCTSGWADCNGAYGDGCEAHPIDDVQNCGSCGKACTYAHGSSACSNGTCVLTGCSTGYASCDGNDANGCETDLQSDVNHCGACANSACAAGEVCYGGMCRKTNVLLLYAESLSSYPADVQSKLQASGAFNSVSLYNATSSTPSLATLQQYYAVLVWSNSRFYSATTLGDNLAAYYDNGGRVVVAEFALGGSSGSTLGGRFGTVSNGYILITPTSSYASTSASLGTVAEPASPLMAGVSSLSASSAYRSLGAVANGGVVVARWSTGEPLIVRGTVGGRNRVDVNMFPVSSSASSNSWTGDGTRLLVNALLYQ